MIFGRTFYTGLTRRLYHSIYCHDTYTYLLSPYCLLQPCSVALLLVSFVVTLAGHLRPRNALRNRSCRPTDVCCWLETYILPCEPASNPYLLVEV